MYLQNFEFLLKCCNYDYNKCFIINLVMFIICIIFMLIDNFIEEQKKKYKEVV